MEPEIVAAIIGWTATVITAILGLLQNKRNKGQIRSLEQNSFVRFIRVGENFKDILPRVKSICMYTVNSYELLNSINTTLEQNPSITIKKLTIMVRKKSDESETDLAVLNTVVSLWGEWVNKKRIGQLEIISYDHDPDHYYTIIGDRLVFCGQVLFDSAKPTGTTINYIPLVFTDETELGQQVISNYQIHFNNALEKYRPTGVLYSSLSD